MKIREDDLLAWAVHAWLRMSQRKFGSPASSAKPPSGQLATRDAGSAQPLLAPPTADSWALAAGLLAHGGTLAASAGGAVVRFTPDEAANALIHNDPFAFLYLMTELSDVSAAQAGYASHQPVIDMSERSGSPGCCSLAASPIATETGHTQLNRSAPFSSLPIFGISLSAS